MEYPKSLNRYVNDLRGSGKNYTQIVMAMALELGYSIPIAHRIVESILNHNGNNGLLFASETAQNENIPDIDVCGRNLIRLIGTTAEVIFQQVAPRIVMLDNFLSIEECETLCEIARPRMRAAKIFAPEAGGMISAKEVRNANTASLPPDLHQLVNTIDKRISELTSWPMERGEIIQVQRYTENGKYAPHYDFFTPFTMSEMKDTRSQGQRLGTLIVYLKTPRIGGATYLTNLGLKISPKQGAALFFNYPDASRKSGTLHSGDPVLSGEKWILTKWFRERALSA